jgi:glycosyltransferase involved in cell wall biosynthesis
MAQSPRVQVAGSVTRILFVSRQFPSDIARSVHGVYIRMRLFLDALKDLAETLEMLFYVEEGVDTSPAAMQRAREALSVAWGIRATVTLCPVARAAPSGSFWHHYVRPTWNFFAQQLAAGTSGNAQILAFESALANRPDAVFFHRLDAMCPALRARRKLPPTFLDIDDIDHVKFLRQIQQPPFWSGKRLYYLQVPALIWGERQAVRLSEKSFVCSDVDRRYLSQRWKLPRIVMIPNAVTVPSSYGSDPASQVLLLVATYAYGPNITAAEYLVRDVWPRIHEACPDAQLIIAGNKPERIPSFASSPAGVEFIGFVENLDALYRRARIVCCPILSGGGTRIKILEAAAHGKAIVSTAIGAEGLELRDGIEIMLRDGPRAFADCCVDLLKDPGRCEALGYAAREFVAPRYDRNRIVALIKDELMTGSRVG